MSISTAENIANTIDNEYFKINGYYLSTSMPIEFAKQVAITLTKLHVEAALKEASEKATVKKDVAIFTEGYSEFYVVDKRSILNSYPLDKIQ